MHLHLRLDEVKDDEDEDDYIVETLIVDGREAGTIRLRIGEYQLFGAALGMGADMTQGQLKVTHDPIAFNNKGGFKKPGPGDKAIR